MSALFRLNSADGDRDGENNRKERFHGTKVSLPAPCVRLPIDLVSSFWPLASHCDAEFGQKSPPVFHLLIVQNRLRGRLAQFKLCTHLLDLRGLFFKTRHDRFHLFF